jgi:hypothetical protein
MQALSNPPPCGDRPLSEALEPGQSVTLAVLAIHRHAEAAAERMRRAESRPALALKAYLE